LKELFKKPTKISIPESYTVLSETETFNWLKTQKLKEGLNVSETEIKKWLENILEAWEDFKELEKETNPDKLVQEICGLYTKKDLARALLILKPLEKPERK